MIEEKVAGRAVIVGLGVLSLVLIATLAGTTYFYTNQISSLADQVRNLTADNSNLQSQITTLERIASLGIGIFIVKNQNISQSANSYTNWFVHSNVSKYVEVYVINSTSTSTYIEVKYSSYGVVYDEKTVVGESGEASFPVLSAGIEVRVGNTDSIEVSETVTIGYVY
jgi:hypothetical protein